MWERDVRFRTGELELVRFKLDPDSGWWQPDPTVLQFHRRGTGSTTARLMNYSIYWNEQLQWYRYSSESLNPKYDIGGSAAGGIWEGLTAQRVFNHLK